MEKAKLMTFREFAQDMAKRNHRSVEFNEVRYFYGEYLKENGVKDLETAKQAAGADAPFQAHFEDVFGNEASV